MDDTLKILIIDSGKTPIHTEKYEMAASQGKQVIETFILNCLNKYGKACHALIKFKNEYFVDYVVQSGLF